MNFAPEGGIPTPAECRRPFDITWIQHTSLLENYVSAHPLCIDTADTETHDSPPPLELVKTFTQTSIGDEDEIEAQSLHCNVDYHIAKFAPPLTFMVYSRARAISYKTGKFYVGAETLANLYGKEERVIRRCYQDLVKLGFFVEVERKPFSTTRFRVLDHDDWVKTHPGQCIPKFEFVWAGEGDKLAQYMHATTGGWVRLYENQMTSIRKIMAGKGLTDDQLLQIFAIYFEDKGKNHRNPKNVIPTFISWLRQYGNN